MPFGFAGKAPAEHGSALPLQPPPFGEAKGEGWGGVAFAVAVVLAVALVPAFDLPGPFRSDGASGKNPKGDVHGCTSFFATTGMSCRKIPLAEWTRVA